MKSIIKHFIKYPVWVNVLLVSVVFFGLSSLLAMKSSFFAPIDPRQISIRVAYPGSSPQEIEEGIILKIEDNLKGIQGVERVTSLSKENSGSVTVEVKKGEDGNLVLQDVKNAVDQISSFPDGMEPPIVYKIPIEDYAFGFAVLGDVPLKTLKDTAKNIERDLLAIDGISLVSISGFSNEEIEVQVHEKDLRAYNLSIEDVGRAIRQNKIEVTGGQLKGNTQYYTLRSKTKAYEAADLYNVVVKRLDDGQVVYLYQIAQIQDTWADSPISRTFNGKKSVVITVNKTPSEDIIQISKVINNYMAEFNAKNDAMQTALLQDRSVVLKQRIALLTKNGITGFILVFVLLAIFLNLKLAFWVASAIPISFLGMFIVGQNMSGMTINVISLFGMIVVIGILVDDGIVIGENIYQHYERGKSASQAALDGALEVLPSVFAAIATTVVAFTPFFFLDGRIADIMNNMAYVVIVTLLVSLIEGSIILPSHLAHSLSGERVSTGKGARLKKASTSLLRTLRKKFYRPLLRFAISNSIITIAIPISILIMTMGAAKGGVIKSTFFPFVDSDSITINVVMPAGTPEKVTEDVLKLIETKTWVANQQFQEKRKDGLAVIETVSREISGESHKGSLSIALLDGETRNMESFKVTQAIRDLVGVVPTAESIEYGSRSFFGKAISISLLGNNLDDLRLAKEALKAKLSDYDKVKDVVDNDQKGAQEIKISLTPQAYKMGFTDAGVMAQVRNRVFGFEAQRTQRGTDEVKIWVRYPRVDRVSIGQLEDMRITAPNGDKVPLSAIANLDFIRSSIVINHLNGQREMKVEANLANEKDPVPPILNQILSEYLPPILAQFPSVSYSLEGQKRETEKTQRSAKKVMPLTLLSMFFIIVLAYRSFTQATLTMLLVPFGYIGMAWGHFVHDRAINMLSIFGFIALIGIMVNDSIVFTNTFNSLMKKGLPFKKAVYKAGLSRFRAILLTSITTIAGLAPLIAEKSRQAQFLIPMAISVAYGLLFATFVILVVLPAGLMLLNRIRQFMYWLVKGTWPTREQVEPAVQEIANEF